MPHSSTHGAPRLGSITLWALLLAALTLGTSVGTQNAAIAQEMGPDPACGPQSDALAAVKACSMVIAALGQQPEAAWAYNNRGTAYRDLGDLDRAIANYGTAIKLDSSNAAAYRNRGNTYAEMGQDDLALRDLDQAIGLDPDLAAAWNDRGVVHAKRREFDLAIADFTSAISLNDQFVEAYDNRGDAHRQAGDLDLAMADYQSALALAPNDPFVLNNIAWTLYLIGNDTEALSYAQQAVAGDPQAFTVDTLAHILASLGRNDEALAQFERAMEVGGAEQVIQYQSALVADGFLSATAITGVYDEPTQAALRDCLEASCRLVD